MTDYQIVFSSTPYLTRAFYVEPPFTFIGSWVTDMFGFKVFKEENCKLKMVYISVTEDICFRAPSVFYTTRQHLNRFLEK